MKPGDISSGVTRSREQEPGKFIRVKLIRSGVKNRKNLFGGEGLIGDPWSML